VLLSLGAFAAGLPHYLITNNDNSQANSATFYTIAGGGQLTQAAVVPTGGFGWDGLGYVVTNKINVSHDRTAGDCVYLSDYVSVFDHCGLRVWPDRTLKKLEGRNGCAAGIGGPNVSL